MSVSGISSSSLFNTSGVQSLFQQFQQTFQQLGKDLQSGNLSAAQSDFATLQNLGSQNSTATSQTNSPIAQAFSQLAKDLQSGNLSAAQQDFSTIQQDFQNQSAQARRSPPKATIIMTVEVERVRSANSSISSAPRCSRAISLRAQQAYSSLAQQFQHLRRAPALRASLQLRVQFKRRFD